MYFHSMLCQLVPYQGVHIKLEFPGSKITILCRYTAGAQISPNLLTASKKFIDVMLVSMHKEYYIGILLQNHTQNAKL